MTGSKRAPNGSRLPSSLEALPDRHESNGTFPERVDVAELAGGNPRAPAA
jgi:hypothetical protein